MVEKLNFFMNLNNNLLFLIFKFFNNKVLNYWGLGIGDWGLGLGGLGGWAQAQHPNPRTPTPHAQTP